MAAAASKASTISANTYEGVVRVAANIQMQTSKPLPLFEALSKGVDAVAGKFDFSFVAHQGPIARAAVWSSKEQQYTNAEAADRYFRDKVLAKVKEEDERYFNILLAAAVCVGKADNDADNVAMTELVLQAIPQIDGKPIPLQGNRFIELACDPEKPKPKTEAFLRRYFNLPAPTMPTMPTIASGSAAAKSTPRTPQDLAADFAELTDADVALRDKLLTEFKALSEDFRNKVYGALYQLKPPANAE